MPAAPIADSFVVDKMALLYSDGIKAFDYGMNPSQDDGICWAIARIGDVLVLIFRGSQTPEDWFRDFIAVPTVSFRHPSLGIMPAGFQIGMDEAYKDIVPLLTMPFIIGGHSLGAARACRFMAQYNGRARLLRSVLCGCPNPGNETFLRRLDQYTIASYRNRYDPVCSAPPIYGPARPFIELDESPADGDGIGGVADHHIALYRAGVQRFEAHVETTRVAV